MIRSMLYATDLGLYAPYVMQHALALARTFEAELYVVHAVEPMGLFAESVLQSFLDAGPPHGYCSYPGYRSTWCRWCSVGVRERREAKRWLFYKKVLDLLCQPSI